MPHPLRPRPLRPRSFRPRPFRNALLGLLALGLIVLSVVMLERERAGLQITGLRLGTTPVTLYERPGATGPAVVVAHGFAGSRQIMQGFSFRLAQVGYRVLAFDFEGQGRNPVPMRGDVTKIDGTTVYLVAQTRRVIGAARALPGAPEVALLGHSMATDIIIRAADQEAAAGHPVTAVVAISSFSEAITPTTPPRLEIISGEWEGMLRGFARNAARQVAPDAQEGELVAAPGVERQTVVAPHVGHLGVLYSPVAVRAARDWLDRAFGRESRAPIDRMGVWIVTLFTGLILLAHPLIAFLPKGPAPDALPLRRFLGAALAPAILIPLVLAPLSFNPLPVTALFYLTVHLALYGAVQIALLRGAGLSRPRLGAVALFLIWGLGLFGLAMDRYFINFWPSEARAALIAVLLCGTLPFMAADAALTEAGHASFWRRVVARLAALASLAGAVALGGQDRLFVVMAIPVLLGFWLGQGLIGRWLARRAGAASAAVGMGLALAWVLGVTLPLLAG